MDSDDPLPKNKMELLERIRYDWDTLERFISGVDADEAARALPGQWSIKDNLAHLAIWERFLLEHHLNGIPAHFALDVDSAALKGMGEDQINALIWKRSQSRGWSDVLNDLRQTHASVLAALCAADFEILKQPDRIETLIVRPVLESVMCNTSEHYREHLTTMLAELRQREAGDDDRGKTD